MNSLGFKPDFELSARRLEAWWHGEIIDRPPVMLSVKPERPARGPVARHATQRERWLDVEFVVDSAIAAMEVTPFLGENLPVFLPNLGPELTATLYGCDLEFAETTAWTKPVLRGLEDWQRIATTQPDFSNRYWQTLEALTKLASERCAGRYLVGLTDLHGTYVMLAALRGQMGLCTDLIDCPELVDRAARNVARGFVAAFERNWALVKATGMGSTCWAGFYYTGPAYAPSCDFWCMVSAEIARDLIVPTLVTEMGPLERSIFHLDGVQALHHLDLTLSLPGLNALQWVYGSGYGPATRWLDVYRRARAAGKSLQIFAATAAEALAVLRELGPDGLYFVMYEPFDSVGEAEAFLREVAHR